MSIHHDNPRPCCPKCWHKGFTALPFDPEKTKVVFKCGQCNNTWNSSVRGGEYALYATNPLEALKIGDRYWARREALETSA